MASEAGLACAVLSFCDEPGLVDAVRSLLDQSDPVEVVVVNSGGGDPAAQLRAKGIDVPVVSRDERLFAGAVRNLGIDATNARYVAFLAADCVAEPGWAAGRIRAHRSGADAVASAMSNPFPEKASAAAAFLLLHNRRTPHARPERTDLHGLSYDRALFDRYGRFREDLRTGEDTELNGRLPPDVTIAWAPDVRAAHRYPTRVGEFLRDQYARGRLRARAAAEIEGAHVSLTLVVRAVFNLRRSLLEAWSAPAPRAGLPALAPLLAAGTLARVAGIVAYRWL